MRGRLNADGKFQAPFSPYKWGDAFTEGNSWHYTWSVFHDVEGLDRPDGRPGRSSSQMLDSVFVVPPIYDDSYYGFRIHEITEMQVADMGNYAHGNQPAQHMIYLYNYAGSPVEGAVLGARGDGSPLLGHAPTAIAATRTTARLRPGMSSRPWGSIPYARLRTNTSSVRRCSARPS